MINKCIEKGKKKLSKRKIKKMRKNMKLRKNM